MTDVRAPRPPLPFLAGGGEMGARMRDMDWAKTPLGPPQDWLQSLRSTVSMLLPSKAQIVLFWGPEFVVLYNDAYRPVFGARHPHALGLPGSRAWPEIWDTQLRGLLEGVVRTGEAFWAQDLLFEIERYGFLEETYFDVSYDPVRVESGAVGGVFCIVTETTERVVGQRRMALLKDLAARNAMARTSRDACVLATEALSTKPTDVTFALVYLDNELQSATVDAEEHLALAQPDQVKTLLLPPGTGGRSGRLIVGINSRRPFDDHYRSFLDLVADQVSTALVNARAYEEERQRAEALAAIDKAKTVFFSNVSHEFRTPLTLMLGPLEDLLARRAGGNVPEDDELIRVIYRNGLRLLKLVNTLLEFSRIEAGRIRARFEPLDLCAITTDLASTFRSVMEQAGLTFVVDCHHVQAPVFVDPDMWEKIVLNLLSNAFKFTLQGGVTVRLQSTDERAVLMVQDTGAGIPTDELPRVFERFHRVDATKGRSHEGSGIGLALVQELVKLHGGDITVESRLGHGTTFTVSIPFGSAHLPREQTAVDGEPANTSHGQAYVEEAFSWLHQDDRDSAPVQAATPVEFSGRILLADDNADMVEYARRLLSDRWVVETVRDGRDALRIARERRPDIIVTDIMMPELDGLGLLRVLRADPELQSIPVILLSARAGDEARIEGLAAGADDYLVKPFSARDLIARVDAQLIKARARSLEQEHARRLISLFTNAPVAIAILRGADHVYELTNAHYRALVGGRELIGKAIREALPELAGQSICELLDTVRATGEPYIGTSEHVVLNRGPHGEPEDAYFDFVYQPTFGADWRVDGIVVVAHDVTVLTRAKAQAEEANRLKDEFLATLSHELRTPLNAILGYTQMLRGGMIDAQRLPGVLETIERNARMQEQLVSDVLDVSRIITGKLRLDVRTLDLRKVIEDAIETVIPAAAAKGVKLQAVLDMPAVPVAGDAQRMQQVVWNLLSNAVKFTPKGGRVQIRLQRVNSHVEIAISDTGEGIAPEFLPHMFQRFTQADGTFSRTHGGLGLGLAICRHLVEAHGGVITATSPGKGAGATIRVELPMMIVHTSVSHFESEHPTAEPVLTEPPSLVDLTGIRVLLVDDDLDALQMARDALSLAGAIVTTTSNANDALAILSRERFDVGIVDIGMPDMDGYELLRRIRERTEEQQGSIPLAALTAYARSIDRTRSLQSGFQLHLTKPVQPSELTAAIMSLADRARRHAEASSSDSEVFQRPQ
jgi:signal transduction histidine kinase